MQIFIIMKNESFYSIIENDILLDKNISDKALRLYAIISNLSNNQAGYCFLNHKQIAELINIKTRQVYNLINELEKYQYITRIKKNNRCYLAPVMNKVIAMRKAKNATLSSTVAELFDYDWIND